MTPAQDKILWRAIDAYGNMAQLNVAVGEIGELLTLIGRRSQGRDTIDQWVDEVADVEIMLDQIKKIFMIQSKVTARIDFKINRLAERLRDAEGGEK